MIAVDQICRTVAVLVVLGDGAIGVAVSIVTEAGGVQAGDGSHIGLGNSDLSPSQDFDFTVVSLVVLVLPDINAGSLNGLIKGPDQRIYFNTSLPVQGEGLFHLAAVFQFDANVQRRNSAEAAVDELKLVNCHCRTGLSGQVNVQVASFRRGATKVKLVIVVAVNEIIQVSPSGALGGIPALILVALAGAIGATAAANNRSQQVNLLQNHHGLGAFGEGVIDSLIQLELAEADTLGSFADVTGRPDINALQLISFVKVPDQAVGSNAGPVGSKGLLNLLAVGQVQRDLDLRGHRIAVAYIMQLQLICGNAGAVLLGQVDIEVASFTVAIANIIVNLVGQVSINKIVQIPPSGICGGIPCHF